MTKSEILKKLEFEMFNHYRGAEYFKRHGHAEEEHLKALNDADCVYQTGRALLGYNWRERLAAASVRAEEQAAHEYRNWK